MLKNFKKVETLLDLFCGVGPMSCRAALQGVYVLANDLNPECHKYLNINIKKNKVTNLIKSFN